MFLARCFGAASVHTRTARREISTSNTLLATRRTAQRGPSLAAGSGILETSSLGRTKGRQGREGTGNSSGSSGSKFSADPNRWEYRYPLRNRLAAAWKGHNPQPAVDPLTAEKAAATLLRRPEKAAELMQKLPVEQRRIVALSWALTELEEEFAKADKDHDGKLSYAEFKSWAMNVINTGPKRDEATDVTNSQLACVAIVALVPFVGFGAVDNGLMVIYGDVIDSTLGMWLGMSMLASAALGNAISNIFGMLLHGTINKWSDKLGLPDPRLTLAQRRLPKVHFWTTVGSTVGVFTGCLLGMCPLLFMDQTKKEADRAAGKRHDE